MFSGATNIKISGGRYRAEGQNANMFDNATNLRATGATFITGSEVEEGNSSEQR
jgi:hypothetical protein